MQRYRLFALAASLGVAFLVMPGAAQEGDTWSVPDVAERGM